MIVRKLRLRKGWSQDQLAELADVSVRTIQRVERGHTPSLETARALAAVFEVDITTFTKEHRDMTRNENKRTATTADTRDEHLEPDETEAIEYAKGIKDFLSGVISFVILAVVFFMIFGFDEPVLYVIFGGIALWVAVQGLVAFEIIRMPFQNMERKIAEKKLGRKL